MWDNKILSHDFDVVTDFLKKFERPPEWPKWFVRKLPYQFFILDNNSDRNVIDKALWVRYDNPWTCVVKGATVGVLVRDYPIEYTLEAVRRGFCRQVTKEEAGDTT